MYKEKIKKLLSTSILILMIVPSIVAQNQNLNVSISQTVNSLNISIDGRQELISIVQYLGGYFRLNQLELDYKTELEEYFAEYKDHEAVIYVKKLTRQGFTYDAPPATMLYFSDDFELEKDLSDYLIKRIGGKTNATEFSRLIKKFADDTKFSDFLKMNTELYQQLVGDFADLLSDFHELETIEKFFGKKQNSYNIILSILNAGNYGPSIETDGKTDIYNILSAKNVQNGKPSFGSIGNIEYLVWHEFGHSFVNYLTRDNQSLVAEYENLFDPIKDQMSAQAYGNWNTVVNEHVIRAITLKLIEEKYGEDAATNMFYREISRSFYYIEPLWKQLDIYCNNRNTYKSFSDFYPVLIQESFDKAQNHNYPARYLRNLNQTFKEIDYIVYPSNDPSDKTREDIFNYVKSVKDNFFKSTALISDREAIAENLLMHDLLIYGTIDNNLVLKEIQSYLPVQITDSQIIADQVYNTSTGKAIFNMTNPMSQDNYIIVYSAQRPEGIIGINNVFHGPTNYVVFEDRQHVYKSGYIVREDNRCICK